MIALAFALLLGQAQAQVQPAPAPVAEAPKAYVSRFCAPIVMAEPDPGPLRQHYADWGAHLTTDDAASAYRPADVDAPGQMVSFDDKAAPHVFIDRRRGMCSLVYAGAKTPAAAMEDFHKSGIVLHQGAQPTPWRLVTTKRFGKPGPIRYFLPASDDGRFGLCATLFEDLRLHDETPATLVRMETCRLGDQETIDNG